MRSSPGVATAKVHAESRIVGALEVPGDKSISHRVAIFSALTHGTSTITGFLQSEDCVNTLRALRALGAEATIDGDDDVQIAGTGGRFHPPAGALDCGNSGTGMRLLAGLGAGLPFPVEFRGDESLTRRPMDRICTPLSEMGCQFRFPGKEGFAPFITNGGGLEGIHYDMPVASAQVKSCILIATLFANGETVVRETRPTRDHTERLLRVLDVPIEVDGLTIRMEGLGPEGPEVDAIDWYVPGDFSSGAYWAVAVAAGQGRRVRLQNVGLNPRRTALLRVLERMGADVHIEVISEADVVEPYGDITIHGKDLEATDVGGKEIPSLIDELPLVAVLGALAEGETVIRDAAELRVKESDRIASVVTNLQKFGVDAEERDDGMVIRGPAKLDKPAAADSYGDHRIAMAMATLGTYCAVPVSIHNIACTETSYPGFWGDLRHMGATVEFSTDPGGD